MVIDKIFRGFMLLVVAFFTFLFAITGSYSLALLMAFVTGAAIYNFVD